MPLSARPAGLHNHPPAPPPWNRKAGMHDAPRSPEAVLTLVPDVLSSDQAARLAYLAFDAGSDMRTVARSKDGRLVEVNETFLRLTGYSRGEVLGHSVLELGLWVEPARHQDLLVGLESRGSVSGFEVELRMKAGEKRL